jgi:chitinase
MQGWANNGHMPAHEIDFRALTHLVHFSLLPNTDGSLDANANSITPANSKEVVRRSHRAGCKVLISVGGWDTGSRFREACRGNVMARFVQNLVSFVADRGYDGVDLDWEPLEASDQEQYVLLVASLRMALDSRRTNALLTAATSWQPTIFAEVKHHFDQINVMTYDMSGAWPGWLTWHNAPVYDAGVSFPGSTRRVPSVDGHVNEFLAAGIPPSKLGIGIDFYGYIWNGGTGTATGGVTAPGQHWQAAPWVHSNVPYHRIMREFFRDSYYRWDTLAQAAYLSIDADGSSNDKFISYDDETTVRKKIEYVRRRGLGGVIIWELGGGHRPELPAGRRNTLLNSVLKEVGTRLLETGSSRTR